MKLLLDTQVWLWMTEAPDRLSPAARRFATTLKNECFLSAASLWEMAIKYRSGKLKLSADPVQLLPAWMELTNVVPLPVLPRHALHVATLPRHHGDPFDLLLIAQAQLENLTILTSDRLFRRYDVKVLPA